MNTKNESKIFTIYDNILCDANYIADWGFSCLIDCYRKRILFDAGAKEHILAENFEKAQINPLSIDMLIISHGHDDHTGGINWITKRNPNIEIYFPPFNGDFSMSSFESDKVTWISESFKISDDFKLIISKNSDIDEMSLVIHSAKGNIIVVGCCHSGAENVAAQVMKETGRDNWVIMGGFHLFRETADKIKEIAAKLTMCVDTVIPCHCTGNMAASILKDEFKEKCRLNGVGKTHVFQL